MQKYQLPRPLAAVAAKLTPRSGTALAVVAVSFFLMVCVARYGADAFVDVRAARTAGAVAHMSAWMVVTFGAGIWALLVLPMAWGAIVYFHERTPDLLMRMVGTLLLAASTSALVGLKDPGSVWAGHLGRAIALKVGGLSVPLGGFGTVLAWVLVLALFALSGLFATDWMFHTLRRGAPAPAPAGKKIATEPPAAALLDDPADAEPRGFISASPHAADAPPLPAAAVRPMGAAETAYDLEFALDTENEYEIHTTLDVRTPEGWDETEQSGRRVIAAPSGYRGVEFLPPSDELATPEVLVREIPRFEPQPVQQHEEIAPASFEDDEFVATRDAAFFVERVDAAEAAAAPEEPVAAEEESEQVEEAVQALFEAVTAPAPAAAPASGISIPADSPFLDEFFPGEASWPFAGEPAAAPSDGASAASEMASDYAAAAPAAPAPAAEEPAPEPAFADDVVAVDEVLVSRLPSDVFEEAPAAEEPFTPAPRAPEPVAEPTYASEPAYSAEPAYAAEPEQVEAVAVAVEEPIVEVLAAEPELVAEVVDTVIEPAAAPAVAPQLDLFASVLPAEPVAAAPAGRAAEPDLARIHALELDPLFRDAVAAVLERGRASAVVLQRQLGIGYARGIRILDQMSAVGVVGPDSPTGSRQIRITKEKWDAFASA